MAATSKKRKVSPLKEYGFHAHTRPNFVADVVLFAEPNEVLTIELAQDGYSGVEVMVTPVLTEIIGRATWSQNVLGEKERRIRELTTVVQKCFNFSRTVLIFKQRKSTTGGSVPLLRQSLWVTSF